MPTHFQMFQITKNHLENDWCYVQLSKICITSAFRNKPSQTYVILRSFCQHLSCHLHGEFCAVRLGSPYIDSAFGYEVTDVNVRAEEKGLIPIPLQTSIANMSTEMVAV